MSKNLSLRLYVAGQGPNSLEALRNLQHIAANYLSAEDSVEVVDVVEHPGKALSDNILLTPTLVRVHPLPVVKIIGTLREISTVLSCLGFKNERPASASGLGADAL